MSDKENTLSVEHHFSGKVEKFTWRDEKSSLTRCPHTDLKKMAQKAMNYFLRTPIPELNYACRFSNELSTCPPGPQGEDLVAHGDTDIRMESTLLGLRALSGVKERPDVDKGLYRRIMGYVGKDNLSYAPYAMCCASDMPPETIIGSPWTTGWTIRSLTEHWLYSHNLDFLKRAKKMVRALMHIAHWDTGRAYYPGGMLLNGKWFGSGFGLKTAFYTTLSCDLLHYATVSGDEEATLFAYALARGVVADLPGEDGPFSMCHRRFRPDGSFTDHSHMHTRTLWGIAMAGRVMQDVTLIEWARRGYEFVRSCGTDFGWFPERIILIGEHPCDGYEERVNVSETCVTGDMLQTAVELARAGYPHYWDHVERYVKNYLLETQFSVTPAVKEFYQKKHASRPAKEVENGLADLLDFEGGFMSVIAVNDWYNEILGPLNLGGCCVQEGARGVVTAWRNTVQKEGSTIKVNMNFDWDGDVGVVKEKGNGIHLKAKVKANYLVRPPDWTDRHSVLARRGRKSVKADWSGDYFLFSNVKKGEDLELTWQVPRFSQKVEVGGKIGAKVPYTIVWEGNRVMEIIPPGTVFPIFNRPQRGKS